MIALDTETHLIKPGLLAPRIVCFSWAEPGAEPLLELRDAGLDRLRSALKYADHLTSHNAPFDLACAAADSPDLLPLIFRAYRDGRIHCTISRQKVIDVALGMRKFRRRKRADGTLYVTKAGYTLAELVELYTGRHLEKEDTWRLRYALLDGVPIAEWPEDARRYAINDAVEHLVVWKAQHDEMRDHWGGDLPNLTETAQAAWALHLMSCWGVRAEAAAVERFVGVCEEQIEIMRGHLVCDACEGKRVGCSKCGGKGGADPTQPAILKPDGTRTMAEIRRRVVESLERLQIDVPRTDPTDRFPEGQVQTDKETLEKTDDPQLHALAEAMTFEKHLGQWGPVVKAGVDRPVCARYNELVETGRTSCSAGANGDGTNFQNPPRKGDVRPCFVPRPGWVYVSTDADTIELRSHAQNCLELVGWSKMADALVEQHRSGGPDLHLRLAANIINMDPYEAKARYLEGDPDVKEARQFAKCFHPDTEVLTREGWRRIADLRWGQEVMAAVPKQGGVDLVWQIPTNLTRRKADELVWLRNEGIDLRVTPDHRMLGFGATGLPKVVTPESLTKCRTWVGAGVLQNAPTYFVDDQILRLAVATQADGSFSGRRIRFGFSKQRKIARMRAVLTHFPGQYEESTSNRINSNNPKPVTNFCLNRDLSKRVKDVLDGKNLPWRWLDLPHDKRLLVVNEARYWDSYSGPKSTAYGYSSMQEQNADVLQALAATVGKKSRMVRDRCFELSVKDHAHSRGENINISRYTYNGEVVCLSVPSTFVLVRDGGVPIVVGQCPNFGFPGGLGARSMVAYAAGQMSKAQHARWFGTSTEEQLRSAQRIREIWFSTYPENRDYFRACAEMVDESTGEGTIRQLMSNRVRGGARFTSICNGFFQGRVADAMKEALFNLADECYSSAVGSVLYGSRPVMFLHDEPIVEHPDDATLTARAERQRQIVVEALCRWMPSIPCTSTAVAMRRWQKGAEPVYRDGRLVPSKPIKIDGKTKWVEDTDGPAQH